MAKSVSMAQPSDAAVTAARFASGTAITVLVLFLVVHLLKPELDPTWRMMSEYSNGDFGWVMVSAFAIWAMSCLGLFVAIKSQVATIAGKIGLGFLLITALGLALAAVFPIDPLTLPASEATTNGKMHGLAGMLCINGLGIAALLISWSLYRNRAWAAWRKLLLIVGGLPFLSLVWLTVTMSVMLGQHDNKYGPEVLIGAPNRVMVASYAIWILTTALLVIRTQRQAAPK